MGFLSRLFDQDYKALKKFGIKADKVIALADDMNKLSDEQLQNKTDEFKNRLASGETLDDILIEAFAVVREASTRVLGMTPFRVQIMGAIAMHEGNIAEMKTGEGKTLTSTLAAYLNALEGKGVHIITVNEYLASRDAEEMGVLYKWLGLTVGLNLRELDKKVKREQYDCDIMYSTNSEIGFDYLRDNMVVYKEQRVASRSLHFAIIDEVDSILIDEARTPLIISGGTKNTQSLYSTADMFAKTLTEEHFSIDLESKTIKLDESGMKRGETYFKIPNMYDPEHAALLHRIQNALRANYIMKRDHDYMVHEGKIVIVDQFTGRMLEGRQYSEGLHQAIEAKEGVEIKKETQTVATITYQNLFRMYNKLSGMTGTAKTEEEEFQNIYNMFVVEIPTNMPIIRDDMPDLIFKTRKNKYAALAKEVKDRYEAGQPVLVGTVAVETSEYISTLLKKHGVPHETLNAKNHGREADIIAKAGESGSVTIATNMAGRGTDIKLGEGVKELGGLVVLGTERHESRRIDNQLRGRSGRQGDPGFSRFYLSLEDDLVKRFGGERLERMLGMLKLDIDEAPIESKMISRQIEGAQRRVEGNNFDSRKNILQYDDVMRLQRETIYAQRNEVIDKDEVEEIAENLIDNAIDKKVKSLLPGVKTLTQEDATTLIDGVTGSLFAPKTFDVESFIGKTVDDANDEIYDKAIEMFEAKKEDVPENVFNEFIKVVILRTVDTNWTKHIDTMDGLRKGIGYRAYGQINPLREYQDEGYALFQDLVTNIEISSTRLLVNAVLEKNTEREQVAKPIATNDGKANATKKPKVTNEKVGRNDPCPCGSGKKYKKCCGQ